MRENANGLKTNGLASLLSARLFTCRKRTHADDDSCVWLTFESVASQP